MLIVDTGCLNAITDVQGFMKCRLLNSKLYHVYSPSIGCLGTHAVMPADLMTAALPQPPHCLHIASRSDSLDCILHESMP